MGTGHTNVKRYNTRLCDLIIEGRAAPGFGVSHELPLDEAPMAYEKFGQRVDGYTKVVPFPVVGLIAGVRRVLVLTARSEVSFTGIRKESNSPS
jgi:glutathione-independent formaldehyde dehydrogenase